VVLGLTKEVFGTESDKLKFYLDAKHPALAFWQEVQYLDPRIASQFQNFDEEGLPPSLQRFLEDSPANILPELLLREILHYIFLPRLRQGGRRRYSVETYLNTTLLARRNRGKKR